MKFERFVSHTRTVFFGIYILEVVGDKVNDHCIALHHRITYGGIGFDSVAPLTPYGGIITGKRATDSLWSNYLLNSNLRGGGGIFN